VDDDRRRLVSCLDLTSLGDSDDEATIDVLCARAVTPVDDDPSLHVAAVCIWPRFIGRARQTLAGTGVKIAAATGGFPVPSAPRRDRLREVERAVAAGADEVDIVVDRRLLSTPTALATELAETRDAAGAAVWKAILETGALAPDEVEPLARRAIEAGADFLKTSTGKGFPGADPLSFGTMAGAAAAAGRPVGLKASGGIRTAAEALEYLRIVRHVLGDGAATPHRFRIGASALLDDLVATIG
jgi:deoxyribose-phosphate aldolase